MAARTASTIAASATTRHQKIVSRVRWAFACQEKIDGCKHYGVNPCTIVPYQLVPSEINDKMSILPTVAVIVGAPNVPHLTSVNVAVVAVPEAGCLSNNKNDLPAVAVGIVNVQAVADVSVAVRIVPSAIDRVAEAPTVPLEVIVSV
jgi:hypothetical protein